MKRTNIGGQGVLEGVMMRSEKYTAIAVRREPGNIVTQKQPSHMLREKYKILGAPVIRGVVNFVEMLALGVKTITDAAKMYDPEMAEEEAPGKAEAFIATKTGKDPMDVAIFFAVVIAIVLAVGLFFILPNLVTGWITPYIDAPFLKNLVDGGVRLSMFLIYMTAITNMKDIKRLFGYHGAEHKVINCYEHEMPLTVESARECSRFHPRCGTSFLLIVMLISILLFSLLGWSDNWLVRVGLRLAMLPVVAGVSYEALRFLGRNEGRAVDILRKPGMALQRLSTREPDDGMLEVALVSFLLAEGERSDEEVAETAERFSRVASDGERRESGTAEEVSPPAGPE
jgi:uncharacterized protein YqhQ